jgi:hypothetical protein
MSDDTNMPTRIGGSQHHPSAASVTPLRLPGQIPPEAHAVAIERLMEAIILSSTISRAAAEAYAMMLKIASVAAPFGEHGPAVSKIIAELEKRLGMHLATLPNRPPPPSAA